MHPEQTTEQPQGGERLGGTAVGPCPVPHGKLEMAGEEMSVWLNQNTVAYFTGKVKGLFRILNKIKKKIRRA